MNSSTLLSKKPLTIALVCLLLTSCAWFSKQVQDFKDMTPKEKSLWMMSIYNKVYAEYQAKAVTPENLSEADKEVMRMTKKALQKAWPLIKAYNSSVNSGVTSEAAEAAALAATNDLLSVGGQNDGRIPDSGGP